MHDDEAARTEIHPKLRIDRTIARGSFGIVFRAHQIAVARDVAVKVLHEDFAPTTEPGRLFRDEIRAIGRIDHRNVVRIFDADEALDGRLYFVMELLQGPTLQELCDAGSLPPARAISLVAQLLDGLAAVHAAGHIHADVKPANAVVCGDVGSERVVLIDFGLSRLRTADRPAEAVGGTRAYMAPEQLRTWQVDARSDVFAAALVLVKLLTGRHRTVGDLAPVLDGITDPALRHALGRALSEDPAGRPSAHDFARALRGGEPDELPALGPPPPFRELAPLTEDDRGRLCGRADDVMRLARRIETSRAVVLTAPSGTGKTSLLRAGLIPYLDASGTAYVYLACSAGAALALATLLVPGSNDLADALHVRRQRTQRLIVILDQLEVAVELGQAAALLDTLFEAGLAIVLGVREDFVARLLAISQPLADGVPQVRLAALDRDGAHDALVSPLAEHGVTVDPALLAHLLDDLLHAGSEMGLGAGVYPPHLQLAGAALFDALAPGERALSLSHYRRLGGFAAVVEEHLSRTIGELSPDDREIARELLLVLVTSSQTRALRSDTELVAVVSARHGELATRRVLARLEARRLLAQTTGLDGAASWSLVHDTLAPRIAAWLTMQDLDRRRSAEMLRFQLRQSRPDLPATLTKRQLAAIARFPGLLEELEVEWQRRTDAVWSPRALVEQSRKLVRYRRALVIAASAAILGLVATLGVNWFEERARRQRTSELSELDLGRIDLTIEPFDWHRDPAGALRIERVAASALPALDWQLFDPDADDPDEPGARIAPARIQHGARTITASGLLETGIAVRGGDAVAIVTGRGTQGERCAPSVIPLRRLPGNADYGRPRAIRLRVPTCRASRFDMREVPAGPFLSGGLGEPSAHVAAADVPSEQEINLPAFEIDRTEITNDAFAVFSELSAVHDILGEDYPHELEIASGPRYPRGSLDWFDARAYCRYLGKELPSGAQWEKALRGGLMLDGAPNPAPRRSMPWTATTASAAAYAGIVSEASITGCMELGKTQDLRRPSPVASHPHDVSPYGVVDLAGSVQEWLLDAEPHQAGKPTRNRPRITRGGNWFDTSSDALVDYMVAPNPRGPHVRHPYVGARCARWQ